MSDRRLLLITPDFPPNQGGVARYLQQLAEFFSDRIRVYTSVEQTRAPQHAYRVIADPLLLKHFWPKWIQTVHLLIRMRQTYDTVIVSHVLPFGTAAWVASWITKKPFVVIVHGLDVRLAKSAFLKQRLCQKIFSRTQTVVANSCALAVEVAQTFRTAMPIVVYPCVSGLKVVTKKDAMGHEGERVEILTVSRLIERKGHVQVLMALSELKQAGKMPPFRYTIVGEGPMRKTLEELAGQLHVDEVEFLGALDDESKNACYARSDFFVMPVKNDPIDKEGFGIVFLEAASYSLASISTQIEGVDEAILHNQTGLLVPVNDLVALENAIETLATDRVLRHQLGKNAYERVVNEFSCKSQFSKLEPYL